MNNVWHRNNNNNTSTKYRMFFDNELLAIINRNAQRILFHLRNIYLSTVFKLVRRLKQNNLSIFAASAFPSPISIINSQRTCFLWEFTRVYFWDVLSRNAYGSSVLALAKENLLKNCFSFRFYTAQNVIRKAVDV